MSLTIAIATVAAQDWPLCRENFLQDSTTTPWSSLPVDEDT
jgi:hypothetical protein